MTTTTHILSVRGHKICTRTPRRFSVVGVRETPFTTDRGTYVAFAEVVTRTDNFANAKARARKYWNNTRCSARIGASAGDSITAVVVDTATGEEV